MGLIREISEIITLVYTMIFFWLIRFKDIPNTTCKKRLEASKQIRRDIEVFDNIYLLQY